MKLTLPLIALVVMAAPLITEAQQSRARTIADSAGTIIGQARACGADQQRLRRIGEMVAAAIESTATNDADRRSAMDLYSTAVIDGDRRQTQGTSGEGCPAVRRSLDNVERMLEQRQ